jgi:hypothetical protein
MIQEDKNQAITATPPAVQPGSPIRNQVQEPLAQVEAPGVSHVVSTAPEGVAPMGNQTLGQVVAPVTPVAPTMPTPVAPVNPMSSPSSAPSGGMNVAAPKVSAPSMPNIGTSIGGTPVHVSASLGNVSNSNVAPSSRIGSYIAAPPSNAKVPSPTPTPAPAQVAKQQASSSPVPTPTPGLQQVFSSMFGTQKQTPKIDWVKALKGLFGMNF